MKTALCVRFHRRCIIKNFGSCRNLMVWGISVLTTVVVLDHFFFYTDPSTGHRKASGVDGRGAKNSSCGQVEVCAEGQSSYHIISGFERETHPSICFDGEMIFSPEKKNGKRGFNLVNINGKTRQVEDVRTFDTYEDDTVFQRYLKLGVESSNIILLTTADEASLHLSEESKKLLASYGSHLISKIDFRASFSMVGQRNLQPPAKAIEELVKRKGEDTFAFSASIKGCVSIPLGVVSEAKVVDEKRVVQTEDKVKVGDFSPSCGMKEPCKDGQYPIRLYTGNKNEVLPSICFKGKYIVGDKLNNPGRGIMVGVVDVEGGAVLKLARFDTYESKAQSEKLLNYLNAVVDGEMIFAVAHDEAYTALSKEVKEKLATFGSSFIKDIQFRNVWVFVGKPGLQGFSPYEDIEPSGKDSWPFAIDAKFCINKKFVGTATRLELNSKKNMEKRTFCKKYDGYDDFCSSSRVDEHAVAQAQTEASMKGHAIYQVPVVLVPGLSHVSLMRQLVALLKNPGINMDMINVMYDEKFEESAELAKLFKVKATKLPSASKYISIVHAALSEVWNQYPQAEHMILLEEEVVPTPDFLFYLGQCLSVIKADDSLAGVSAFNENGFVDFSSELSLVYRGVTFPSFGVLLKKSFYQQQLKGKLNDCCSKRSWFGWKLPANQELLYPDVSRVGRRHYLGLTEHASFLREYINAPRVNYSSITDAFTKLAGLEGLGKASYNKMTNLLLSKATPLPHKDLVKCIKQNEKLQLSSDVTYVVYYEQELTPAVPLQALLEGGNHLERDSTLVKIASCLGLSYVPFSHLRGSHEGTIRLQYKKSQVVLVSDASPYYKNKLLDQVPFRKSLIN